MVFIRTQCVLFSTVVTKIVVRNSWWKVVFQHSSSLFHSLRSWNKPDDSCWKNALFNTRYEKYYFFCECVCHTTKWHNMVDRPIPSNSYVLCNPMLCASKSISQTVYTACGEQYVKTFERKSWYNARFWLRRIFFTKIVPPFIRACWRTLCIPRTRLAYLYSRTDTLGHVT